MQQPKLNVYIAFLAYGGNGNVGMQLPSITTWFAKTYLAMKGDPRIGQIFCKTYGDVPLSMERNRIVKEAKDVGADVILMLDSDNVPDLYVGNSPRAKPFWESSFEFLYKRALRGLPTVVCASYCGPPPHPVTGGQENVYVFYAEGQENQDPGAPRPNIKFTAYTRDHAALMTGIQPIAAGPTGVIMYSSDAFDLMPKKLDVRQVLEMYRKGEVDIDRAKQLIDMESWFYYEYTDAECTQKASTEDVTSTREIQLAGIAKHGESVVFCNWDAWAGHMKPKCVGAPNPMRVEQVSQAFAETVRSNISAADKLVQMDLPPLEGILAPVYEPDIFQHEHKAMSQHGLRNCQYSDTTRIEVANAVSSKDRVLIIGDKTGEIGLTLADCRPYDNEGQQVYFLMEDFTHEAFKETMRLNAYTKVKPVDCKDPNELSNAELDAIVLCLDPKASLNDKVQHIKDVFHAGWHNHLMPQSRACFVGITESESVVMAKALGFKEIDVRADSICYADFDFGDQ